MNVSSVFGSDKQRIARGFSPCYFRKVWCTLPLEVSATLRDSRISLSATQLLVLLSLFLYDERGLSFIKSMFRALVSLKRHTSRVICHNNF